MATKKKLLQAAAGVGGGEALNVEEVFSTYLYEGNGSTQTITNDIDLSGEGGLTWIKIRNLDYASNLYDTERGATNYLQSSETAAEFTTNNDTLTSFNSNGFSLDADVRVNRSGYDYASWTFRKAPKFFDVVTYTGNGASSRSISHGLNSSVGSIIIKRTDSTSNWPVWHRSTGNNYRAGYLNLTNAGGSTTTMVLSTSSSAFTVGNNTAVNASGGTYVAYLFAHNNSDGDFGPTGDQDIIKCGSYTGNGSSTGPEIDLGFEPQWILVKQSSASGQGWIIYDAMRGLTVAADDAYIAANDSGSELTSYQSIKPTPTGFQPEASHAWVNSSGSTYIYIAIRRGPMAVPESADDVFDIATRDGTEPHFNSNFDTVDFALYRSNISSSNDWYAATRLTTNKILRTNSTGAEIDGGTGFVMDFSGGWYGNSSANSSSYSWMWKRAHGYFDTVAYHGNSTSGRTVSHNLGVAPEMIWVKNRDSPVDWWCYHKDLGNTKYVKLNGTDAATTDSTAWNNTTPTDTVITLGNSGRVNYSNDDYIAYLFASLDGVSKVGSYTGDGTTDGSNVVDCGFTNGARFILVKMADGTSNWGIFDTERGIVSGNDSRMFLDTTAAQLTTVDFLVPNSSGFAFKNGFNSNGFTYIFYAIAA